MAFRHAGWQRSLRNIINPPSDRERVWSEWKQCTEDQAEYASKHGHVEYFPTVEARVRKFYVRVSEKSLEREA